MSNVIFDDFEDRIKEELSKAKKQVKIAVAWINFELYGDVFNKILSEGVELHIIVTSDVINNKVRTIKRIEELRSAGACIKLQEMATKYQKMHHKFCIIDQKLVLNGSYNWSKNASKNCENLMFIKDRLVIRKFNNQFDTLNILTKDDVKKLQKLGKCNDCGDEIRRILVVNEQIDRHLASEMKIIDLCGCGYKELENNIIDESFYFEFESLRSGYEIRSEEAHEYDIDEGILQEEFELDVEIMLIKFFGFDSGIHAIGIIGDKYYYGDEYERFTKILWKNSFVGSFIDDEYNCTFGLA